MFNIPLVLLFAAAAPADHEKLNPLYRELRQVGLAISPTLKEPLPLPTMPDGLDAEGQKKVLMELVDNNPIAFQNMLKPSQVAPHLLRLRDIKRGDPKAPARGVDVWFVAYGDLKAFQKKEFLETMLTTSKKQGNAHSLTGADLQKRSIKMAAAQEKQEGYGHLVFSLFDKVEISATGRSFWSQTEQSALAATRLEPAFNKDEEFPNQWRALVRGADGRIQPGPAHPYDGAAYYVKVTRLVEPAGALFVEAHVVFTEPHGWFGGANFLRSKLPLAVQSNVRNLRRELAKASK